MKVQQFPDQKITIEGTDNLYFGGTNYLGMSTNEHFQNVVFESIKKWGTAYGSSRSSNIKLSVYETAEKLLATKLGSEAALAVSSGMLAGKLLIEYLSKKNSAFFHFPGAHPAIMHPSSLPIISDNELNPKLLEATVSKIVLLTDSFPSMTVKPIDLSIINKISKEKEITLVIDESHSLGIYDTKWAELQNNNNVQIIKISSLGKALGLSGGVIAANDTIINEIKNQDTFIGASGMNPAFLETFIHAQEIYEEQKHKLLHNLHYLDTHFNNRDKFTFNPKYPAIYFDDDLISKKLFENKIIFTSFKYTNSSGKLNRIIITSNHSKQNLEELLLILNS